MRNTTFNCIDSIQEKILYDLCNITGEHTQLEMTMYVLDSLMGWCELCFNNDVEEEEYKLLRQAWELLDKVHKSYHENHN